MPRGGRDNGEEANSQESHAYPVHRFPAPQKRRTFILKPDAGCQGKGISLVQSADGALQALEDLRSDNVVAQQYLARPFLIDGYKFDLRIYVLVLSCEPLSMFIFREGLVRFCTEEYEPPREDNLDVAFMHLTNCASVLSARCVPLLLLSSCPVFCARISSTH